MNPSAADILAHDGLMQIQQSRYFSKAEALPDKALRRQSALSGGAWPIPFIL
jgi:hypothetical protein